MLILNKNYRLPIFKFIPLLILIEFLLVSLNDLIKVDVNIIGSFSHIFYLFLYFIWLMYELSLHSLTNYDFYNYCIFCLCFLSYLLRIP